MDSTDDAFFSHLENSYLERCRDTNLSRKTWKDVMDKFPADMPESHAIRPALALAKNSGDLGLALIWTVQAALVRPLLSAFSNMEQASDTQKLIRETAGPKIGALAISEEKDHPLMVRGSSNHPVLSGRKKYITGGSYADFILLAGRRPEDEKLSRIFLLPVKNIPENAFTDIDLGCFYTNSHARMTLENYNTSASGVLSVESSTLRKLLIIWGIIERSIILESLCGLALYLAEQTKKITGKTVEGITQLESELLKISPAINEKIKSARNNDFIQPLSLDQAAFSSALGQLRQFHDSNGNSLPEHLEFRFRDLFYFSRMMGPG